jgi:hypothetical protein
MTFTNLMLQLSTGFIQSLTTDGGTRQGTELLQGQMTENTFRLGLSCTRISPRCDRMCYTTVILNDVRSISISRGEPGKTRARRHISGLRVDFFSPAAPVYVGQWFEEIESFRFKPGDRIVSLTFWQTQETAPGHGTTMLRENAGKIAGIRIVKVGSEATQLEVCLGHKEHLLEFSWHENLYEELVGVAGSTSET